MKMREIQHENENTEDRKVVAGYLKQRTKKALAEKKGGGVKEAVTKEE